MKRLAHLRRHLGDLTWQHVGQLNIHLDTLTAASMPLALTVTGDGATVRIEAQAGTAELHLTLPIPGAMAREVDYALARASHPAYRGRQDGDQP